MKRYNGILDQSQFSLSEVGKDKTEVTFEVQSGRYNGMFMFTFKCEHLSGIEQLTVRELIVNVGQQAIFQHVSLRLRPGIPVVLTDKMMMQPLPATAMNESKQILSFYMFD